jgi:hypothetical protein
MWTPRGYIFVDGYWDYPVGRRGMLFAPVYFNSGLYSRRGYNYSPSIVLDLALFAEHLFLRPNYHHYYFGDYYDVGHRRHGYYAAHDYHSHRFGYDPIFSHQRWEHRNDRGWDKRMATNFEYRRDNENARPPRTWDALRKMDANSADSKKNKVMLATPLDQMTKRKDGPVKFQAVDKEDRQALAKRGKDVRQSRDERRMLEAKGVDTAALKTGEVAEPAKVKLPKSSIVGKSASEFKKDQAPPTIPKSAKILVDEPKGKDTFEPKGKIDKTDLTPREPKGKDTIEPRKIDKTDLTPREPKGKDTIEPRKIDKTDLTPREPKGKDTIEPRKIDKTDLTPREPKGKGSSEPRKIDRTDLTPREPKHRSNPEPRIKAPDNNNKRMSEPPAKSKSDSNDKGEGKSGKKDRKKDSSNN